jgi:hypothetical protein
VAEVASQPIATMLLPQHHSLASPPHAAKRQKTQSGAARVSHCDQLYGNIITLERFLVDR